MTKESRIKANKFLIKCLKEAIDPWKETIQAAYLENYAPDENSNIKTVVSTGLADVYDMAACLLFDWTGDSDYEDCERDLH